MEINVEKTNFHPVLKDIENMNWFFVLSHKVLARPDVQDIVKKVEDPSIIYMLEKYNKWVNLQIEINGNNTHTSKLNVLDSMIFTGKMMSILLYEFLASSSYNEVIERMVEDDLELNQKTKLEIEAAKKRIASGKFLTQEQVEKRFLV